MEMHIKIEGNGDDYELDTLRMGLSEELSMLNVSAVEPVTSGEVPANARAIDAVVLGELLVKLGPQAVKAVVTTVRSWLQRSGARKVELEIGGDAISITNASETDQERLINLFIASHEAKLEY